MQRVVYDSDSDLVVGVVGEAFSGKFFTFFGAPLEQVEENSDLDMRGALERTTEDLLATARELDGKEIRCKVLFRYGYVTKSKVVLEGPFKKVASASHLMDEVMQFMLGDMHAKSKAFKCEFRIEKKVERGNEHVSFLSMVRFPCLQAYQSLVL